MAGRLVLLILVLTGFTALSAMALIDAGYFGIIRLHFQSWGGAQVFADLVILAVLACLWMRADARARGVAAWPFILITVFFGSFGPLIYLLVRAWRPARA